MLAILPFSGFTEQRIKARGVEDLWVEVLLPLSSPNLVIYSPEVWHSDPKVIMSELRRANVRKIMLIGYSWGAGYGCIKTARFARDYGISIPLACFCDPVFRSALLPTYIPINPLSLLPRKRITVPPSIKEVRWVKQKLNLPGNAELVAESPNTKINPPIWIEAKHAHIDESEVWFDLVKKSAIEFTNEYA